MSLAPVASVPWLVVPKFFPFGFAVRWDAVLVFVLALVPASIGSMALYHVVAGWGNEAIFAIRRVCYPLKLNLHFDLIALVMS